MSKAERFEEMRIWQQARLLAKDIYAVSSTSPFTQDFGLRDQIRRSAVSIMSNIAEGFERESNKEFIRFLVIAKASAAEVRSQLYLAADLGYISDEQNKNLHQKILSISKQTASLITYLKRETQTS